MGVGGDGYFTYCFFDGGIGDIRWHLGEYVVSTTPSIIHDHSYSLHLGSEVV